MPAILSDFFALFLGLVFEALPFLVLGLLLSVAIEVFIPTSVIIRYLPKRRSIRRLALSCLGFIFPVCECGNVPTARAMLRKGLSASDTLSFLLAAPILNPVTIATTVIAFGISSEILLWRVLGSVLISQLIGFAFANTSAKKILTEQFRKSCTVKHSHASNKRSYLTTVAAREMSVILPGLLIGALIASLLQIIIPRELLLSLGSDPIIGVFALAILAFVVSICANVDAFFALSISGVFTNGALITFLLFGPLVDIKIISMLRSTFSKTTLIQVTAICAITSVCIGLGVNYAS